MTQIDVRERGEAVATGSTEPAVPPRGEKRRPRNIILFSDGTGNSSGKLFKTNVWRLYEAVDLGPLSQDSAQDDSVEQIAFYSNGVGTSNFQPLAILGGVFGIGLKPNILSLYRYLCRNWMPGDRIFLFGFSRGAFTIRLLVGLIASQGILRGDGPDQAPDEDQLSYLSRAAYRAFSREAWPNRWLARQVSRVTRAARDHILELGRRISGRHSYDRNHNCMTDIAFVGVWDTVAAYGGPIVEITRGIDDWIWPLTMPNYQLATCVQKARHALALDDERDAFQPLLWDEVREEILVKWGGIARVNGEGAVIEETRKVSEGRLKQVWFSGMHADVGGGYPDESLSYVSLLWMIDELSGELRLLPEHVRRIASMSNIYGPIHDSRSGLGAYYRFQPRRIAAMVDWRDLPGAPARSVAPPEQRKMIFDATRMLRDPEFADQRYQLPLPLAGSTKAPSADIQTLASWIRQDHGLLTSVRVHESVLARIASGTDNYAPVSLPQHFDVVLSPKNDERPRVDVATIKRLRDERRITTGDFAWYDRQARIWDKVWLRRVQYFLTAFATAMLLFTPLWDSVRDALNLRQTCIDARCVARPVLELANTLTGGLVSPWVRTFTDNLWITFSLAIIIAVLFAWGSAYDLRLRSKARRTWRRALGLLPASTAPQNRSRFARFRDGKIYQGWVTGFKWQIAPSIAGLGIIAAGLVATAALLCQLILFPIMERNGSFCGAKAARSEITGGGLATLNIADSCTSIGQGVAKGQEYSLRLVVRRTEDAPHGWYFSNKAAQPAAGHGANMRWWRDVIDIPFRRVLRAGWAEPLVGIQIEEKAAGMFGRRIWITRPKLTCDSKTGAYVGKFTSLEDGELNLFVNDMITPFDPGRYYRRNQGSAYVQVWSGDETPPLMMPDDAILCSVADDIERKPGA